jgi:hypothetical protein
MALYLDLRLSGADLVADAGGTIHDIIRGSHPTDPRIDSEGFDRIRTIEKIRGHSKSLCPE